jgi:hypothetical protein
MSTGTLPPILLIAYNRADTLAHLLAHLRRYAPPVIYFSVDGPNPRKPTDAAAVAAVQALASDIDWPCELHTRFGSENLGCRRGVSAAISWFFSHVTEGIILEDDILVGPDCLPYLATMLAYYRHQPQVFHLSTNNFNPKHHFRAESYYASHIPLVWGWATWRDRWQAYERNEGQWETLPFYEMVQHLPTAAMRQFYAHKLAAVRAGTLDAWSYYWALTIWQHGGVCLTPKVNLSMNIGVGLRVQGANFKGVSTRATFAFVPWQPLGELAHPTGLDIDHRADSWTYRHLLRWGFARKLRNKLWSYWERFFPRQVPKA